MDALDILKIDFDRITSLLDDFKKETGAQSKRRLLDNIEREFARLAHVEENLFFPALKKFDEASSAVTQLYEDIRSFKRRLSEFKELDENNPEFGTKVSEFGDALKKHFEFEKSELFPSVRKIMKRPERDSLGRHIEALKREGEEAA